AQQLNKQGYLSQASLDTALARQQSAAAQVAAAQASQGETAARLEQTSIRAPVSGLIIRRSVTKGQIVTAGSELFRLVRDNRLELDAQIPETELPLVKAGMPATVTSGPAGAASGHVRIVTSEVDNKTRLGLARIALSAPGAFRPGMFARAEIQAGDQMAASAPSAAVLYRENHPGVFVLDANNKAHFRRVAIIARAGDRTAMTGLAAGERVVVEGSGFLGEGDQVRVGAAPATAGRAR
ncbi:MAG: transporter, partial [Caulobacter sp.]|nr:transporter [Caulobacter sp.]